MRLVVVESPYAGDVARNERYLRACLRDCLIRGEAPYASHALYTLPGVLDDSNPVERRIGMEAGFSWRCRADATIVYDDLGVSHGMEAGIRHAREWRQEIEYRRLGGEWAL
jgi:hypothetical protein